MRLRNHLRGRSEAEGDRISTSEVQAFLPPLTDGARTFINMKLDGLSHSNEQRITLIWSALVMGSFLLQKSNNRYRTKGHIIHVNLSLSLGLGLAGDCADDESCGWNVIESLLSGGNKMGSLWHPELKEQWHQDWLGSMQRQRRWEQHGVWMIGAPKRLPERHGARSSESPGSTSLTVLAHMADRYGDIDVVEYLVLREARDSLPKVE